MINNVCLFPRIYAGYLFYETLTRDIRDDSDIKNTASQMKDGAKILQKSVMCSFNGENFSKKMYFLRFFASS